MEFYKDNIVTIGNNIDLMGWRCLPISLDNVFKMWMCQTWKFFPPNIQLPYNEFVDTQAEFPLYFFSSWAECEYFVKNNSPRYTYDRQMFWLRLHREYWFSTIAKQYLEYIQFQLDAKQYFLLKNKTSYGLS